METLDVGSFGGGLTPVARVGGRQTKGLALRGADGRDYTFRAIDKDPTSILPEELQDTWARSLVQDQIAASQPAAFLVADELMAAAGILHAPTRLVVMPDDPRLGEFRQEFAATIGQISEFPGRAHGPEPRLPRCARGPQAPGFLRAARRGLRPARRTRLPESAALRPPGRRLGPSPRPVALGALRWQGFMAADPRRPRPGVLALRGSGGRPRASPRAVLPELRRHVSGNEGPDVERPRSGPSAVGGAGKAGVRGGRRGAQGCDQRRGHREGRAPDARRVRRERRRAADARPAGTPRPARRGRGPLLPPPCRTR